MGKNVEITDYRFQMCRWVLNFKIGGVLTDYID
jgi:hypothetical protein